MRAILNNEITELNEIPAKQLAVISENARTLYDGKWYYNPCGAVIAPNAEKKPSVYHKWNGTEWIAYTTKKQDAIKAVSLAVETRKNAKLAAGLEFAGNTFPLTGDAYAHNMAAASAYTICQGSGGRELLTISGSYVHVDDIAGLVSAGNELVTSTIKDAIDEIAALPGKTTAELIEILNP